MSKQTSAKSASSKAKSGVKDSKSSAKAASTSIPAASRGKPQSSTPKAKTPQAGAPVLNTPKLRLAPRASLSSVVSRSGQAPRGQFGQDAAAMNARQTSLQAQSDASIISRNENLLASTANARLRGHAIASTSRSQAKRDAAQNVVRERGSNTSKKG